MYFGFNELEDTLTPYIVKCVIPNKLNNLCDIPSPSIIWKIPHLFRGGSRSSKVNHSVCYLIMLHLQDSIKKMVNTIKIEKFTVKNSCNFWCIKMQALLKEQGIWAPLSGQPSKIDKSMLELQEEKMYLIFTNSLISVWWGYLRSFWRTVCCWALAEI